METRQGNMQFQLVQDRPRLGLAIMGSGIVLALVAGAVVALGSPAIGIGLALGVIAALVVLSNIEYGLYAVFAIAVLLPFGAVPLNIGFNPTFLDLALAAAFGMWILRGLTGRTGSFVTTSLLVPLIAFLVLAVFSFVAGLAYAPADREVVRHFAEVLISVALFFVVVNVVQTREGLGRMVTALILLGFVSALLGVALYFMPHEWAIRLLSSLRVFKYPTGDNVLRYIEDDPNNALRAISTSVDPNVLGGLLILMTALTAPQLFAARPLLPRPFLVVVSGTMLFCLLLTFSRGAFLGLGLALAVVATVRYRPMLAAILLVVILMLLLPFTQEYVGHFQDAFMGSDRATQMRLGEYKDALNLISRYPVFGVGFGGSPDIDTYVGVSNVYLLIAEEMGLVGLGAFLISLGVFYHRVVVAWFQGLARDPFLAPILLGVAGAILGAMIGGMADHYFFNLKFPHSVALFWTFVALGMVAIRLGTSADAPGQEGN